LSNAKDKPVQLYHPVQKGEVMLADFLSRNVLKKIQIFTADLTFLQQRDKFASVIINFSQNNWLPADK
jgi:hypothetical protein